MATDGYRLVFVTSQIWYMNFLPLEAEPSSPPVSAGFIFAYTSIPKMEAIYSSETSNSLRTTRCYNQKTLIFMAAITFLTEM
jgi:hypothetical protein